MVSLDDVLAACQHLDLEEALGEIIGRSFGAFLSRIPGKLAYVEKEDGRWILERQ